MTEHKPVSFYMHEKSKMYVYAVGMPEVSRAKSQFADWPVTIHQAKNG
ncbi:hypothetical protein [Paraglaciecola arctica]|nr:hypothetical protein [Paraglaciecola arctica]MBU3005274.1 hypothetical protein [Paraglaciecola arctica]